MVVAVREGGPPLAGGVDVVRLVVPRLGLRAGQTAEVSRAENRGYAPGPATPCLETAGSQSAHTAALMGEVKAGDVMGRLAGSGLAQQQIECPAAADMGARAAEVVEDVFSGAAGVFEGVC